MHDIRAAEVILADISHFLYIDIGLGQIFTSSLFLHETLPSFYLTISFFQIFQYVGIKI